MICPIMSNADNQVECLECYCELYVSDSDTHTCGCAFATSTQKAEAVADKLDAVAAALDSIAESIR